jgi:hypothetical protein
MAVQAGMDAERARLYHGRTYVDWPMQLIRIGEVCLLAIAGEPFIELAKKIVAGSPFADTLVSGYSNGGFGYLPTAEAFAEGGYEVRTSIFSELAGDVFVHEALKALQAMSSRSAAPSRTGSRRA